MFNLLRKLGFLVVLIIVLLSGCDNFSKESGSFSVKFTWPENNKPDFSNDKFYAWVDIREWLDGDADNIKVHLKEGPVAFSNEGRLSLKLKDLSYGKNRVIVVEVRKSNSDQDRTLYYGISELFNFSPGEHTDVAVNMNSTPGTQDGQNSFAIAITENDEEIQSTASEKVSIRVSKVTGSKVVFSNRLDLLDIQINNETRDYTGSEIIDFSELVKIDDITFEYSGWDLTEGREDAESGDGNKTVYAKVIDDHGYRSEMAYASVTLDTTPPSVSNVTVSPAGDPGLANIGTQVVVKFILSEPVEEYVLHSEGIEMTDKSSGSDMYFVYTVTDADVDGASYSFKVSAKDNAGNELKEFELGAVKIDSTLPELLNFSVSKEKVKTGEEFSVDLEFSEALKNLNVLVGAKSISEKCNLEEGSETKYICRHFADIDGDEGDGVKQIAVELTDLADNRVSQTLKKDDEPVTIEYDITAPILASAVILPEVVNRSTESVNVKFSFVEKVKLSLSDLKLDPLTDLVFDCGDLSIYSKNFECSASFQDGDERVAEYSVSVSVNDEVGNESVDVGLGKILVDRESPRFSSQNVTPEAVKLNEEFVITFSVSEELIADPLVRVGNKTLPESECVFSSTTSLWTCTHQANKDGDEPDGIKAVSAYLVDKAGNAATITFDKSVGYDATAPVLISPVVIPGQMLNAYNDGFQVRFSFSEKIRNDSSFVFSVVTESGDEMTNDFICSSTTSDDQTFSCIKVFDSEDISRGNYTFFVDAYDLSGNRLPQDGTANRIIPVMVDRKVPSVEITQILPTEVNSETEYVDVTFTMDEPAGTKDPVAKLGSNIERTSPLSVNSERTEFVYRFVNADLIRAYDGTQKVQIEAEDTFGNIGYSDTPSVFVDRTLPTVVDSTISHQKAKKDDEIIVTVTFSEKMKEGSVKISDSGLGLTFDSDASSDQIYVYRYRVQESDSGAREKDYAFSILGDDLFDNRTNPVHNIGSVTLDLTPPSSTVTDFVLITATSSFYDINGIPAASAYQPNVDFSFTINNAEETESPDVSIGYEPAATINCVQNGTDLDCAGTYIVGGSESEGTKMVGVLIRDDVGNLAEHYPGSVVFDFTGPQLVSTSITRDPAFSFSRDTFNKIQYFSPKDPLSEADVQLNLSMYSDEPVNPDHINTIENLPCLTGLYTVESSSINGNSLVHSRPVNECVGIYNPSVVWGDYLGNESTGTSDWTIFVENDIPEKESIRKDYVTYFRRPLGLMNVSTTPEFSVFASKNSVSDSDIVKVLIYTETGVLGGSADVNPDGSFDISGLASGDVPVVYLNPVNYKGNKIPVKDSLGNILNIKEILDHVPNVVWTANLNRKIAGSSWPNTTTFLNSTEDLKFLSRDNDPTTVETGTLPDSVYSGVSVSKMNGDKIQTFSDPMSSFYRVGRASAYNPIENTLLVFGGKTVSDGGSVEVFFNDLALWNGENWRVLDVEGVTPDSSKGASMVYFEAADNYVLFGGLRTILFENTFFGSTWIFNGSHWVNPGKTGPVQRAEAAFAYDPVRKVAVLFGGKSDTGSVNLIDGSIYADDGTWEWNGIEWINVVTEDPESDGDPDPSMGAMAYSYSLRKIVYHDGVSGNTWAYDGSSWENLYSTGPLLKYFRMAYDSYSDRLVISGGVKPDYSLADENYAWDNETWKPYISMPYEISEHVSWFSKNENRIFVTSGQYNLGWLESFRGLLELDNGLWKERSLETHPVKGARMCYYPTNDKIYLFGGDVFGEFTDTYTYSYDGLKWDRINNGATRPAFVSGHDIIYYPPEDVLLLYDATSSKMWQFNGSVWSQRTGSGPSKVSFYKMAYHESSGNVVFLANVAEGGGIQTWTYNGSVWTAKCQDGVPGGCIQPDFTYTFDTDMTYVPGTNKVYAFTSGDYGDVMDLMYWNGSAWYNSTPTDPEGDGNPLHLHSVAASYSSKMGGVIVTGTSMYDKFEVWLYKNGSFRKYEQYEIPRVYFYSAEWSESSEMLLVRGGQTGTMMTDPGISHFYTVRFPEWVTPSMQYIVPLSTADIPDGAKIQKMDIKWIGGGNSRDSSGDVEGAVLKYWNANGWDELVYGTGSAFENSLFTDSVTEQDSIDSMQTGFEKNISFKLQPIVASGYSSINPVVSTSGVEVDVFYNIDGKTEIIPTLDKEYLIPKVTRSWSGARDYCITWGGDLFIPDSETEMEILTSTSGYSPLQDYWIGIHDIYKDMNFRAVSGREIWTESVPVAGFVNWGKSYPVPSVTDNCVVMDKGLWMNESCISLKGFICERDRENRYIISTEKMSWNDARNYCQSAGQDLVIVDGHNEHRTLSSLIQNKVPFWLGYTDADTEGTWRWVNGTVGWIGDRYGVSYYFNKWNLAQPDNTDPADDYAYWLGSELAWKGDSNGSELRYFICEEIKDEFVCFLNSENCAQNDECCSGICSDSYSECVSCLENGDGTCSTGETCCSGACSTASGICKECLGLNELRCDIASDCCDKNAMCSSGKCCYSYGETCKDTAECCSGMSCHALSQVCCKNINIGCKNGSECCTGLCSGSKCSCAAVSQTCSVHSNCCSGICFKGTCQCSELGGQCLTTADCCAGSCYKGVCEK